MTDSQQIVYLNGRFLPIAEATVSVLDRGFIYGDGVYELIPVYGREPFRLPQHLARLAHTLAGVRMDNPHTDAQWESIIRDLAARQPYDDQGVYFQVRAAWPSAITPFPRMCRPRCS